MEKVSYFIPINRTTLAIFLKVCIMVQEGLLAHKGGTMRVNLKMIKQKEREFGRKGEIVDMRDIGQIICRMASVKKNGSGKKLHMRGILYLVRNRARANIRILLFNIMVLLKMIILTPLELFTTIMEISFEASLRRGRGMEKELINGEMAQNTKEIIKFETWRRKVFYSQELLVRIMG